MSHSKTEDKFLETLMPVQGDGLKALDIGTGYGETGLFIRAHTFRNGRVDLTGVEPYRPYYEFQLGLGIYDYMIHGEGQDLPFGNNQFDLTIAQQVIEHLTPDEGLEMILEMKRVTRGRIILATPNGFYKGRAIDDNPLNLHRSVWTMQDFKDLGFNVELVTKNINSRALIWFAKAWFKLKRAEWDNGVLIAWSGNYDPR